MKYSLAAAALALLQGSTVVLADLVPVYLKGPTPQSFRDVVRNDTYDFGCRAVAKPSEDGSHYKLHAWLTEPQIEHLSKEFELLPELELHRRELDPRQSGTAPISKTDRFAAGTISPVGLGVSASGTTIASIMNVGEIKSALDALVKNYGLGALTLPYKTFNGATQYAYFAGAGTDKSKYHLYLSAAVHARERGGPDNVIYWVSDLLAANKSGSGLTYGKRTYTNAQVKQVLAAGVVIFPLVNADGVAYDQANSNLWRKNRNTKSGSSGSSVGVDINRNFDFLWNFKKYFDPSESPASTSPSSEIFYGTAAESEPETKNLVSVYDSFPKIRWFVDVHSAVGDLLYSWGDDDNQVATPAMNFLNSAYDGKRGPVGDSAYREYIPSTDLANVRKVGTAMVTAMKAVGGRAYSSIQAVGLYPTSGASDDYSFSRFWAKPGVNKVYGYTLEFGPSGNFYPTSSEFNTNILDTNAGFMDWALAAISVGLE